MLATRHGAMNVSQGTIATTTPACVSVSVQCIQDIRAVAKKDPWPSPFPYTCTYKDTHIRTHAHTRLSARDFVVKSVMVPNKNVRSRIHKGPIALSTLIKPQLQLNV